MCQNPELFNAAFIEACEPVIDALDVLNEFVAASPDACTPIQCDMLKALGSTVKQLMALVSIQKAHYIGEDLP